MKCPYMGEFTTVCFPFTKINEFATVLPETSMTVHYTDTLSEINEEGRSEFPQRVEDRKCVRGLSHTSLTQLLSSLNTSTQHVKYIHCY